jgi:hypothetical protein
MRLLLICLKRPDYDRSNNFTKHVLSVSLPYVVNRAGTPRERAVSGWLGAGYGINISPSCCLSWPARIYSPEKTRFLWSSSDRCVQRTSAPNDMFRRAARSSGIVPVEEIL